MNYQEAVGRLNKPRNQEQKKVANNTVLYWTEDQCIMLRLHATNIIVYYPDGTMVLSSGGWKTGTTKDRLNDYLPNGWQVIQRAKVWYLVNRQWSDGDGWKIIVEHPFADGMTIHPDGTVTGAASKTKVKRAEQLDRMINRYSKTFVEQLAAGEVKPPSHGDCWYCAMRSQNGLPLGEETGRTDHLDAHLKERYYVPSLLRRAVEVSGASIAARDYLTALWHGASPEEVDRLYFADIAKDQLRRALRVYLRRQYGLAS